jgi:hypothetical protein
MAQTVYKRSREPYHNLNTTQTTPRMPNFAKKLFCKYFFVGKPQSVRLPQEPPLKPLPVRPSQEPLLGLPLRPPQEPPLRPTQEPPVGPSQEPPVRPPQEPPVKQPPKPPWEEPPPGPPQEPLLKRPAGLPQELVDMIISYIYDIKTLLSCSKTCRLFYIAAVPRLHYSLTTFTECARSPWPKPLVKSHQLHLLPFIKRFGILVGPHYLDFTRKRFGGKQNPRCFSALKNLQELRIDRLKLSSFVPHIKQYFGHFAPTLRSLILDEPEASCRQILYFTGLFPNLRDLKLLLFTPTEEVEIPDGLVPLSQPPLDGWLTLRTYKGEKLVDDMIALYGKLPFRCLNLSNVEPTQRILGECVKTLETLQLNPQHDPYGENSSG